MNAARRKVEDEGRCRVCRSAPSSQCDAAHVIDRSMKPGQDFEEPDGIVPLCSRIKGSYAGCHDLYDAHQLDLLPYLSEREQAAAVEKVGIYTAFKRTTGETPEDYRPADRDLWEAR